MSKDKLQTEIFYVIKFKRAGKDNYLKDDFYTSFYELRWGKLQEALIFQSIKELKIFTTSIKLDMTKFHICEVTRIVKIL